MTYSAFFYGSLMSKNVLLRGNITKKKIHVHLADVSIVLCGVDASEHDQALKLQSIRLTPIVLEVLQYRLSYNTLVYLFIQRGIGDQR